MPDQTRKIKRALISVSDKTGIVDFATQLAGFGISLISTGGTARALKEAGLEVRDVADVTGFPEMMDGRLKTLHPKVHGGLLAVRGNPAHRTAQAENGIEDIDLLAVNLYPFERTVASGSDFANCVENIDIGGPTMIRAAAKNHDGVAVIVDPSDYDSVLDELRSHDGATTADTRRALAAKAFARTAAYDAAIGSWFAGRIGEEAPRNYSLSGTLRQSLRYGENPHQQAALYRTADPRPGVASARQIQGKALSFNNLNDTDAAYELIAEFDPCASAAVAIIKHANPCGVATGGSFAEAYRKAFKCDSVSAFGGIVALNGALDAEAAEEITRIFTEVVIAPEATEEALAVMARKKDLRLLLAGGLPDPRAHGATVRTIAGGFLLQGRDAGVVDDLDLRCVTRREPTPEQLADLKFAFRVCKHVKSNTIVYARDGATVGVGAGQMSRVDAARIAARKARDAAEEAGEDEPLTVNSVAASDAFFPFADGLLAVAEAGATAVIQPGGSMRDKDVIAAANEAGLAMVFTGMRHFRH